MTRTAQATVRNNVKAPIRGICRMTWDLFDSAVDHIDPACVEKIVAKTGFNAENVRIELRRWKRFNGIPTGRTVH